MNRAPSRASGLSHAHHQDHHRHRHNARRRSARRHGVALSGSHRQARPRPLLRRHGQGNPIPHRSDGRGGAADIPGREPVPQHSEVRERQARGLYEEADQEGLGASMSLNFLATRFQCTWPWTTLVMLCDGRLVCGCADPYGKRVLGDARAASIREVWSGPVVSSLREELNGGGSKFCGDCPLKVPLKKGEPPVVRSVDAGLQPSRMYIECTAACNISCTQACCAPETGITRTRQAGMLDVDLFCRVIDEAGPSLVRVDFFNYGEAFLHKRAVEMCEYIKSRFPHIYLYTSTNGLALSEEQARRLVHSGIDEVTFSIDGATPESYVKFRQRGKFDVAIATLRAMADEKQKSGRDLPFLNWRYILFVWNDTETEMDEARRLAGGDGRGAPLRGNG